MSKKSDNAAQAKYLRKLITVVNDGELYEQESARAHVMFALEDLANILDGKPKRKGTHSRRAKAEMWFWQLTGLYWLAQTQRMREVKSMAWARTQVASLTGWKVPRSSKRYADQESRYLARLDLKTASELAAHKTNMVELVPADKREDVAFAIGLRKK